MPEVCLADPGAEQEGAGGVADAEGLRHVLPREPVHARHVMSCHVMSRFKNNRFQVVGMAARYEKRLIKIGKMENYDGVLLEYIERKTLVPVTENEIKKHEEDGGHVNYIGHQGVEKDTSTTTTLRLVAKL